MYAACQFKVPSVFVKFKFIKCVQFMLSFFRNLCVAVFHFQLAVYPTADSCVFPREAQTHETVMLYSVL